MGNLNGVLMGFRALKCPKFSTWCWWCCRCWRGTTGFDQKCFCFCPMSFPWPFVLIFRWRCLGILFECCLLLLCPVSLGGDGGSTVAAVSVACVGGGVGDGVGGGVGGGVGDGEVTVNGGEVNDADCDDTAD